MKLQQAFTAQEIGQWADELGVPYTSRYDVELYVMEYTTIDTKGELTSASGAVIVPQPFLGLLPIFSFQHGTTLRRSDAPSGGGRDGAFVGLLFSAEGYLSVMPDLIGLGSSTDRHPYMIADVSATAVIDMLRAIVQWSETQSWTVSKKVLMAGYSSGGYTALAAQRAIEAEYSDEFTLIASAPMAGSYDLSGTMLNLMLQEEPYPQPYYLPYILLSYNEAYDLYERPSEFLASPYDVTLPPLFDGTYSSGVVNDAMPQIPIQIVREDVVQGIKDDPEHPFLKLLQENDLLDWTPQTPTRLYHCAGDELVPIENSKIAAQKFGSIATLVDPSPRSNHYECAFASIVSARAWFNSIGSQGTARMVKDEIVNLPTRIE